MARHLVNVDGDTVVGSVAWVRDDARPLVNPQVGSWGERLPSELPAVGDVFSSVCPIRWAPTWNASLAQTMQPGHEPGLFFWFYNRQGMAVSHDGLHWLNTLPTGTPNVWEPGVANWRAYAADAQGRAVWVQPSGAWDAYPLGFEVTHPIKTGPATQRLRWWRSTVPANVWEPGVTAEVWVDLGLA